MRILHIIIMAYLFSVILTPISARSEEMGQYRKVEFFENSTRRDPSKEELLSMVKLGQVNDKGIPKDFCCAGFFVKNTENRILVASARHCLDFQATSACQNNKIFVTAAGSGNIIGQCLRIVAASAEDDMFIFEAVFRKDISDRIKPLTLAYGVPPQNTRLRTIGYPSDKYRKGKATVTENCWVNRGSRLVTDSDLDEKSKRAIDKYRATLSEAATIALPQLQKEYVYANCSVYGGNSGGPAIIEGTDYVIGLPTLYWAEFYAPLYNYASTQIESTNGFIRRNRESLESNGVELADLDKKLSI